MNIELSDIHASEKLQAQEALYQVMDPELFVNVIDLGLIYDINFEDDVDIIVTMTLSTPHCPMGEAITIGVQNALTKAFPGKLVKIDLTFDPPWSFEMISEEGRAQLGV
ncbi:metal-sulfur cluster assembly factor [Pseudoflavitalea rhizosphaerae]|uniref:metal-sulfur cluster assembly factor n=1 Tax=Pseudoflavitalea rhizosphaerae TaxID=1884793 RepID=UPI000F8CF8DF|nr:metal-sulfur cluster assembly factor [Pseudoflavitalea rhizosphaerae]